MRVQNSGSQQHLKMASADDVQCCSHCGNVISRGSAETIHKHCKEQLLQRCDSAVARFKSVYAGAENVLVMAIHVDYVYGLEGDNDPKRREQKRYQRSLKLTELTEKVSALRNTDGGYLLVQLVGLNTKDTYLGFFDEFVDKRLYEMIEDGKLFDETYKKQRMSEHGDCNDLQDFVVLTVMKGFPWTTSDFKTKIALDDYISNPLPSTMIELVKREVNADLNTVKPSLKFKGDFTSLEQLHERRDLQLKGFVQNESKWLELSPKKMAKKIWEDLRLKEYITAFSKNTNGGSYLFGVTEEPHQEYGYKSKKLTVKSVPVRDTAELESSLRQIINDELLICAYDGEELSSEDIVEIQSTQVPSCCEKYIIEIAVRQVEGIIFYDKAGPVSFKIEDNKIKRVNVKEWFQMVKHTQV